MFRMINRSRRGPRAPRRPPGARRSDPQGPGCERSLLGWFSHFLISSWNGWGPFSSVRVRPWEVVNAHATGTRTDGWGRSSLASLARELFAATIGEQSSTCLRMLGWRPSHRVLHHLAAMRARCSRRSASPQRASQLHRWLRSLWLWACRCSARKPQHRRTVCRCGC